jgi:PAS domain S-box-containing protein
MVSGDVIAVLGASVGAAILTATLLYMRTLPDTTPALSWWAAAMAITTLRQLVFLANLTIGLPLADLLFEALVAFAASFFLGGALVFMGQRPRHLWIGGPMVAILLWLAFAHQADFGFIARTAPAFLGASLALLLTGALFLRFRQSNPDLGFGFVGVAFIIWGFHLAAYPFLRPNPATIPWGFTLTQGINLAIALGLILSIQRRQAAELRIANRRADNSATGLAETESRFRDFAEVSSDWLWEMGPDLRFSYVSENVRRVLGIEPSTSLGRRREEFANIPQTSEKWRGHLDDLEARRPFRDFAYDYVGPDGRTRYIVISGKPLFDVTGKFLGYRGTGRDATAEFEAAERASHAQQRLVGAIEGLESGIALFDRDDRMVMCNPAFRAITQLGDVLQPGLSFLDYLKARVASGMLPLPAGLTAEQFIAERYAHHLEPRGPIERRMLDGQWFHIREHRLQDGSCMIFLYDITATKERERDLAEKTALLQGTLENMGEGISVFDAGFRIVAWNERLMEMTGHPRAMFQVGMPLIDFVRHNAQRGEYGPGDPEERAQEAYRLATLPHPQRQARWRATGRYVELRRNPMPGGGFVTVYSDITERKQAEDALREAKDAAEAANRTKSGILANMSHELRTPLNAIIGFSDIIRRESFGPIAEKRYLGYATDINDSGTHLLALINDILDVSKAEAGRIELSEGVIDIPSLFEASLRLVRPRADEAGVSIVAEPTEHLPRLRGDTLRLKQVLINLLSNAIKFTASGGRVTLSSGLSGSSEIYLRVEDTGIGMTSQDIPKALSPFGQLDSSLARKHHGTGLGLPLSKALAELHGGRLELQSTIGVGTTVTVYLPAARVLAA